eukprot:4495566-Alexandrium_andersonii.AAC.1
MSASLVGSEMCIRDSVGGAHRKLTPRPRFHRGPSGRDPERRDGPQTHAVSYTHLTLPTICSV